MLQRVSQRKRRGAAARRRGAAVVEFALWIPPIALLVFASIESANMIFLDQSVSIASYEAARAAIKSNAVNADVTARCNRILNLRQVNNATVSIDSPTLAASDINVSTVGRGEQISVTVSAPCSTNTAMSFWFFNGKTVESTVTMAKE